MSLDREALGIWKQLRWRSSCGQGQEGCSWRTDHQWWRPGSRTRWVGDVVGERNEMFLASEWDTVIERTLSITVYCVEPKFPAGVA